MILIIFCLVSFLVIVSIFIDIGCNYGAFSIPIAKLKTNLNIFCFDPSKKSLNKLKENIKLNDLRNIKYFELGIGEKKKQFFLMMI